MVLDKTQEQLIGLLREIDDICRENNIKYFLDGGTALGAVRHDGFIPWDNDADIAMTEADYKRFAEIVNATTDKTHRAVQDNRINREYPLEIGRYLNLDMTKITITSPWWNEEKPYAGLMIDIFLMVPLPKDPVQKRRFMNRFCAYAELSNESNRRSGRRTDESIRIYKRAQFISRLVGKERVLRWFEKRIFNQDLEDFDEYMYLQSGRKVPRVFPRSHFDDEPVRKPFSGLMLPVSRHYHEELRIFFDDDYWKIPGSEGQLVHAPINNANIPCRYYVRDYMRFMKPETVKASRLRTKEAFVIESFKKKKAVAELQGANSRAVRLALDRRTKDEGIDLIGELEAGNYGLLKDLYEDYFSVQFSAASRYWPIMVRLSEEEFYVAIMLLINDQANYGRASWIVRSYRENISSELPPLLKKAEALMQSLFIARSAFDYEEYDRGLAAIRAGLELYPDNRELNAWELNYRIRLSDADKLENCLDCADELLVRYPGCVDIIKAKGDIMWKLGRTGEAHALYDEIYDESRDGMQRLDIERKRGGKDE